MHARARALISVQKENVHRAVLRNVLRDPMDLDLSVSGTALALVGKGIVALRRAENVAQACEDMRRGYALVRSGRETELQPEDWMEIVESLFGHRCLTAHEHREFATLVPHLHPRLQWVVKDDGTHVFIA